MPSLRAQLTRDDVACHIRQRVFSVPPDAGVASEVARHSVGIELEWLTGYRHPHQRLSGEQAHAVVADLSPLPAGSRLTIEPGGQLELSSRRCDSVDAALAATATDLFVLDRACAHRRIELIALGADPVRPPVRVLDAPRYAAMETYFDVDGWAGRTMMCNTASIQLNLGLGPEAGTASRWRLAHAISPALIACFANSPFANGSPSGWQSTRLRSWWTLDASRAAPPELDGDPIERWIEYVLNARVMLMRFGSGDYRPITKALPFGRWMVEGHEAGWPTLDDLAYHLTTLFPPVRPRGWFELRVFDALPTPFWHVAVAITHAILDEPEAAECARRAVAGTEDLWVDAAQLGLGHPLLERAARELFGLALEVLHARSADGMYTDVVAGYFDRWTARGRAPADDRLDDWRRHGSLFPSRQSPIPYAHDLVSEIDLR
jgi:glutamate--cysteine ligase